VNTIRKKREAAGQKDNRAERGRRYTEQIPEAPKRGVPALYRGFQPLKKGFQTV
jgi:hypothetical protein